MKTVCCHPRHMSHQCAWVSLQLNYSSAVVGLYFNFSIFLTGKNKEQINFFFQYLNSLCRKYWLNWLEVAESHFDRCILHQTRKKMIPSVFYMRPLWVKPWVKICKQLITDPSLEHYTPSQASLWSLQICLKSFWITSWLFSISFNSITVSVLTFCSFLCCISLWSFWDSWCCFQLFLTTLWLFCMFLCILNSNVWGCVVNLLMNCVFACVFSCSMLSFLAHLVLVPSRPV